MKFCKMHGAGNDYVYINAFEETVKDPAALAVKISDRHFGVGGDGLICICPSQMADVRMEMYNLDGSQGKMCGNGIRCVGKYAYEHGLVTGKSLTVETAAGIKKLDLTVLGGRVRLVRVEMGSADFSPAAVPVKAVGELLNVPVSALGQEWRMTALSVGNPHAVVFTENIETLDLPALGPALAKPELFPEGVNVEFAEILSPTEIAMRVWERGSGETLACGTGACATLAAAVKLGYAQSQARLHLRGGELLITWDTEKNQLFMTGPAVTVFEGELSPEW